MSENSYDTNAGDNQLSSANETRAEMGTGEVTEPPFEVGRLAATEDDTPVIVVGADTEEAPPLGLRPRWIVVEERMREIEGAFGRYNGREQVPVEWYQEYHELLGWWINWRLEQENYARNN